MADTRTLRPRGASVKGYMKNHSSGKIKYFLFNPTTYSESRSVNFNEIDGVGGGYPLIEFSSGGASTVPLELYFRGTYSEVNGWCKFIKNLCPKKKKKVKFAPPPIVTFALGKYKVKGVVASYSIKYTDFNDKARPIEAAASIKITEVV